MTTLTATLGGEQVYHLYMTFCSDLQKWIEVGSFAPAEAHSHLGAALNLGAGRLAAVLRAIEAREGPGADGAIALSEALSELRSALMRHRLLDRAD